MMHNAYARGTAKANVGFINWRWDYVPPVAFGLGQGLAWDEQGRRPQATRPGPGEHRGLEDASEEDEGRWDEEVEV